MEHTVNPEEDTPRLSDVDRLTDHIDERVSFALAAAQMGVFEWDPLSDVLTWWSRTTGLGMTRAEAPTSGCAFFDLVHPDDRSAVKETRARAIRDRTDAICQFRIVCLDGTVHWVQGHGRIMYDTNGKAVRVLGVNTEITHRKSLEEELRKAHVEMARLHVLKATMRTVQDIVGNALMSLQLYRFETEEYVPAEYLKLFDEIIKQTTDKVRALADLDHVVDTNMAIGTGIEYPTEPEGQGD